MPVKRRPSVLVPSLMLVGILTAAAAAQQAQQRPQPSQPAQPSQGPVIGLPVPPLGAGPFEFQAAEQQKIRVSVVTRGLSHPWSVVFLPDGSMLVTERPGRVRVIRNGVLDPTPIAGVPRVRTDGNGGLMDIALHPRFAENKLVYLTYTKPVENGRGTPTLARGRLNGGAAT